MEETIQKAYQRLHRLETDEIVEYAYNLEQQIKDWDNANDKLEKQLQQYKQQIDELKHKIQLLQMDGQVEVKDLLTLLQILKERK